jgi:hypothetical protein
MYRLEGTGKNTQFKQQTQEERVLFKLERSHKSGITERRPGQNKNI